MKKYILTFVIVCSTSHGFSQVGIETLKPTETLHVKGEARIENLPTNGQENAIYTNKDGSRSNSKDQTFKAKNTVVVDENGVLGTLTGVSPVSKTSCYASTTRNFSELANDEGVAKVDMERFSFEYRPDTTPLLGGNYLYVINNTSTTYYGKSKGDRDRSSYFRLPPNEWHQLSSNINYDEEESGEMIFFTDVDGTDTQNSDFNFYNIEYYTEKRVSQSFPSVCINVTRLK